MSSKIRASQKNARKTLLLEGKENDAYEVDSNNELRSIDLRYLRLPEFSEDEEESESDEENPEENSEEISEENTDEESKRVTYCYVDEDKENAEETSNQNVLELEDFSEYEDAEENEEINAKILRLVNYIFNDKEIADEEKSLEKDRMIRDGAVGKVWRQFWKLYDAFGNSFYIEEECAEQISSSCFSRSFSDEIVKSYYNRSREKYKTDKKKIRNFAILNLTKKASICVFFL
jgi:hypothetical protein